MLTVGFIHAIASFIHASM